MSQKSIFKQVEVKGDGTDPEVIEFGRLDYKPERLVVWFSPRLTNIANVEIYIERSGDGLSWFKSSKFLAYGPEIGGGTYGNTEFPLSTNAMAFLRLPLGQLAPYNYKGTVTCRVLFE